MTAPLGVPRPAGARPAPVGVPPLDAAARARKTTPTPATAAPAPGATAKPTAAFGSTSAMAQPTSRQPPAAVALPIPKPRSMMATQLGVAPPPAALEVSAPPLPARAQPAFAATQLDAAPPPPRVPLALDATYLDAGPPKPQHLAFADTQLGAPRPAEVDALLDALDDDAPTVVKPPEFLTELALASEASHATPQPPVTTRSPEVMALAATQQAPSIAQGGYAPHEPAARAEDVQPTALRAPLSSEAFATTQDTLPPPPMSRLGARLPAAFNGWSNQKLLGFGCFALVAAIAPLVVAGVAINTLADKSESVPVALDAKAAKLASRPAAASRPAMPANAAVVAARAPTPAPVIATPRPTAAAPSPKPAANPPARVAPTPAPRAEQPAPQAQQTATRAAGTDTSVPWLDRPSTSTPSCDAMASVPSGPKGFLLQQAVKRGQRELIRGNVKAAHTAFCEAVLLGQATEVILIGLTQVLLMQSDTEAALKTADQLLALKPNDRVALDLRGDILIRMGRADEARETWFRAAGASRVSASLIDNLRRANRADAVKALRAGDLARADRLWRRVIALDVRDVEASTQLAAILAKDGKIDAAKRWLAYAETLDPAHPKLVSLKSALSG